MDFSMPADIASVFCIPGTQSLRESLVSPLLFDSNCAMCLERKALGALREYSRETWMTLGVEH